MASKKDKKTLVLLDAHAILHRAYHALPDFSSPSGEPTGALYGVVTMILKIADELKPDYIVACYDLPEPTYRHIAYEAYKSGRKKTDEELVAQINRSRDIMEAFSIPVYEKAGFEADDILGTIVEDVKGNKDLQVIIASGDMDTLQLVDKQKVQVYTLRKGIKDTVIYDEKAVIDRFGFGPNLIPDYKGLRGDPSDNIPGVAGIGDKGGTELVVNFGSIENIYKQLERGEEKFLEVGIKPRVTKLLKESKDEALFSKELAIIRRDADIQFSVPNVTWKEGIDADRLANLFSELDFRSLRNRVSDSLSLGTSSESQQVVDEDKVKRASVMLWLLESDRTNASLNDIIDYGRSYFKSESFEVISNKLEEKLSECHLTELFTQVEEPLIEVVDKVNKTGVLLDTQYLHNLSNDLHKELKSLEKSIYKEAGTEFNINSPKQMSGVLFDKLGLKPKNQKKTATGQRSTKESELEKLREEHLIISHLLRYRELQKLVSTYVDNLPVMVTKDGRLHTTFLQTGTTTGRMASQNPNLQNIPVRSQEGLAIRKAFVAPKGYKLVSIDYSQIELRIGAILSQDPSLLEIFKNGEDVHQGVAERVFKVNKDEVTLNMRRQAKVINFGILYGMGVNALRQNLGGDTTREEAQEFLNAYFNTFTRLAEYLEETKGFARLNGYTETLFGRRRNFPGIRSNVPFMRAQAERMAINAPIQGTAADCMRLAMLKVYEHLKGRNDALLLLQVHDELVFEIKETVLHEIVSSVVQIMESVLQGKEAYGVPLLVDVKVGDNWRDLESYKK
ncbi:hypothetical protein CL653_01150 [bacterium]|mgnify:CR=1 FL=1|nr:hypothetical protein [bacterium]